METPGKFEMKFKNLYKWKKPKRVENKLQCLELMGNPSKFENETQNQSEFERRTNPKFDGCSAYHMVKRGSIVSPGSQLWTD